jgi:hypothetical protein
MSPSAGGREVLSRRLVSPIEHQLVPLRHANVNLRYFRRVTPGSP